ncbi:unnamed protein product [Phytophthora fragariaefolia]|uniref:Unnamed protein product n=1 Tax=Phytophthora fragariaefolia TaxID=1490495 RepID=A0A9W6TSY1_9STRA|nr:unnamed protein product [Phytophthora fragariaefolia]
MLTMLDKLSIPDDLWVVDTGAGHAVSPDRRWFNQLSTGSTHTFEYGNKEASTSTKEDTVGLSVLNPRGKMTGGKGPRPLHSLHLDSLSKIKIKGLYGTAGYRYALAIVDDATAYKWYFILKSLKELGGKIKHLITQLERQFPYKVKKIRNDGGSELVNKILKAYCDQHGLIYQHSNVESQEENRSAERAHQTVMGNVRCALLGSGMAAKWWPEVLMYMTEVVLNLSEEELNEVYALVKRVRESVVHLDTSNKRLRTNSPIPTSSAAVGGEAPRMSVAPIPRPRRKRTPNSRLRDYVVAINVATITTKAIPIPRSLKEARHGPYAKQWGAALQAEYHAFVANQTWELVPLPKDRKLVRCHWVFDVKYKPDGTVERFKTRLVARGNTQI